MEPWITIAGATVSGSDTKPALSRRNGDFAIRISGVPGDSMNSRMHLSEVALAELACIRLKRIENARILVSGLGMGFTLAAVLRIVPDSAEVIVAELVPEVNEWNRGPLGQCAGRPLEDGRTRVHPGDIADLLKHQAGKFDAILLDIDNGPEAMTASANEWLYSSGGLKQMYETLRPRGYCYDLVGQGGPAIQAPARENRFRCSVANGKSPSGQGQPP